MRTMKRGTIAAFPYRWTRPDGGSNAPSRLRWGHRHAAKLRIRGFWEFRQLKIQRNYRGSDNAIYRGAGATRLNGLIQRAARGDKQKQQMIYDWRLFINNPKWKPRSAGGREHLL